jgi:hypothetical protein
VYGVERRAVVRVVGDITYWLALVERVRERKNAHLAVLGPLVLPTDLVFLLGCEVILDIEGLTDLLGRLALDHVGYGLAADIKESLDVEVVGGLVTALV